MHDHLGDPAYASQEQGNGAEMTEVVHSFRYSQKLWDAITKQQGIRVDLSCSYDKSEQEHSEIVYCCHNMHIKGVMGFTSIEKCESIAFKLQKAEALRFFNDGFFIAQDCIDTKVLSDARLYINSNYHNFLNLSKRQDDWRLHYLADLTRFDKPFEHVPILNLLVKSPHVIAKIESLMGTEISGIFYSQIALRTPVGDNASKEENYSPGAEYHIDGQANGAGDRFPDHWTIQIGIALVDIMNQDMGNFTVFPGSHSSRSWIDYCKEKKSKTLPCLGKPHKICLKAGDVVFAHVLLPHRGGKNICKPDNDCVDTWNSVPNKTREIVFIRVRGKGIDYSSIERSIAVLQNPWHEHTKMIQEYSLI